MDVDATTIFFDIGDTLYFCEEMEKQYPQKLYELISGREGISIDDAKSRLQTASKDLEGKVPHVTKVAAMGALGYSRSEVHQAFCSVDPKQYLKPDRELNGFLETLSQQYPLGIITNFKKSHALEILSALEINPKVFTHYVTEDVVTNIKPDPEPFLKAVQLSGSDAGKCFYVADSISKDLKPAKEAGMNTIWLTKKTLKEDQRAWVDRVVGSVMELRQKFLD